MLKFSNNGFSLEQLTRSPRDETIRMTFCPDIFNRKASKMLLQAFPKKLKFDETRVERLTRETSKESCKRIGWRSTVALELK
jgi:hypothetical protein